MCYLPFQGSIIKYSVAGLYLMINNPGAVMGCSTLLPLKQQVSAAGLNNSKHGKEPSGAQAVNILLLLIPAGPRGVFFFFLSCSHFILHHFLHLATVSCLLGPRLPSPCPRLPLLNRKKLIPTSLYFKMFSPLRPFCWKHVHSCFLTLGGTGAKGRNFENPC